MASLQAAVSWLVVSTWGVHGPRRQAVRRCRIPDRIVAHVTSCFVNICPGKRATVETTARSSSRPGTVNEAQRAGAAEPEDDLSWLALESDPIPAGPHADRRFVL
ncbi:hypothetical protein GCM10007977_048490 [Dactylosporangium sucinum]|uniref:Uncharacterized protein n=1 Tax=Dactylosporangium sucinum TaxID=1424081 RepID=A0A917TWP9_9ACTN|nr:hypothetical protein GCM10007977_048490 [Dactylosporangium sucinum]